MIYSENGMNRKRKYFTDQIIPGKRLFKPFFLRDVLVIAPEMIGKNMVVRLNNNTYANYQITEVEAYRGVEDKACHASKGRTARTEVMFHEGGRLYVYLIYGMYWMLNIVTGQQDDPQAILIRGVEKLDGPGKITKATGIDGSYNGEDLDLSERIWFEDSGFAPDVGTGKRIGIEYSGTYWESRLWRYYKR